MDQPVLESKRLRLRSFSLADAGAVKALAGDPLVSQSTLNIPYPYTLAMAERWIETHPELWRNKSALIYAIVKHDTQLLIGTVALVSIDGSEAELGYWLGREYWGRGYCNEAVEMLIEFAVNQLQMTDLHAEHLQSNPASGKVMAKNAMHYTGSIQKKNRDGVLVEVETYRRKFS